MVVNMSTLLLIFVLLASLMVEACFQTNTNAQSNLTGESRNVGKEDTTHFPETTPTPEIKREVPFDKELSLDKSIWKDEFSFAERRLLKNELKWGDVCSFDSENLADDADARIRFLPLGKQQFVVEVFCNQSGAYSFDYLLYYYSERKHPFTAQLLSFEYFDKDEKNDIIRHFTSNPVGVGFDEKKREVILTMKFSGAAQCGWEGRYAIRNRSAVLITFREQLNCDPGLEYHKWKTRDLNTLRKNAKKTVNDRF